MPKEGLSAEVKCFNQIQIGHIRDNDGFSDNWYDKINTDENYYTYFFEIPKVDNEIYVTVETYYQDVIPNECTTGTVDQPSGEKIEVPNPIVYFGVYK